MAPGGNERKGSGGGGDDECCGRDEDQSARSKTARVQCAERAAALGLTYEGADDVAIVLRDRRSAHGVTGR